MKHYFILLILTIDSSYALESIKQSCLGCHGQNSEIAPSFEVIHKQYIHKAKDEEKAVALFEKFIKNPANENVVLSDALMKYGSMPVINLTNKEIKEISLYLAKGDYTDLYASSALKIPDGPLGKGNAILKATKSELGKNLLEAIKNKKTIGAITFCNTKAMPITQVNAEIFNAQIKRASDKPRNPQNRANIEELKYIDHFKKQLTKGDMEPVLVKNGSNYHFYAPIVTNQMCLQCHGVVETDINKDVFSRIKTLYPSDQAIGYGINELRGIFSIHWNEK